MPANCRSKMNPFLSFYLLSFLFFFCLPGVAKTPPPFFTIQHPTFCPIAIAFLLQIATEPHAYPSPTLLHTRMYNRDRLGIAAKVITPPHCIAMPHVPFVIAVVIPCLLAPALPLPLQKPQTKPGPDQPHQEPGEVYLAGLPGRLVRTLVQLVG